jgi:Predicted AAA-ATPase/PD-(D/E)XK nuclease superfamily
MWYPWAMKKRPLPIGISDFKKVIEGNYAYVDKTLLIKELVDRGIDVALIPRMRRFGKTLNLSMIRYFFEKSEEETSHLFKPFKIWQDERCRAFQGQFPVIFLSLKDVKFSTWQETFESLCGLIALEFNRHRYLLDGESLNSEEKEIFTICWRRKGGQALYAQSLLYLTEWLHRFHKKKVILLIDEYDTPAHAAFIGGYYDILVTFLRNWLSGGLKDNSSLERGILTGILRLAKESIFSGLNNVSTFTILNDSFNDKFGLLEGEVNGLLQEYGLEEKLLEMRKWYNGYRIGSCEGIYNPWSVLKCIDEKGVLSPYWVNTSDNALIKQLITKGSDSLKIDLELLLKEGVIERTLEEGIVFSNLEQSPNAIWSLLLFSGYLTLAGTPAYGTPCKLRIPNIEVGEVYRSLIFDWFEKTLHEDNYYLLLNSLVTADIDTFSQIFQEFILSSFSAFDIPADEPEKVYHAFVLGLLTGLKDRYELKSNRESGYGRYDVMLIPKNLSDLGIIIEFKKVGRFEKTDLESAVASALKQIEERNYAQELLDRNIERILYLALAFEGKRVAIRSKFRD